jgi:glycosyltransferase involved in cell wall biosynthesis
LAKSERLEGKEIVLQKRGGEQLLVGIPAYNEEKSIAKVIMKARKYADRVVVCDDGSSDLTGPIAEAMGAEVIRHEENCGYGVALQSLFDRARDLNVDVLVTLDADGQHRPEEIPSLVRPILQGEADVAIGSRFLRDEWENKESVKSWYRRLGIGLITRVSNAASELSLKDAQSGFRAYSRRALKTLSMLEGDMGASVEILLQANKHDLRVKEISATCNYDDVKSSKNPVRHGASVLMSLLKLVVEDRPLVFLGLPGTLSLILGMFFGVWMLRSYAIERRIITNIALASIAFVLIGFFFLSTAITLYAIQRVAKRVNQNKRNH